MTACSEPIAPESDAGFAATAVANAHSRPFGGRCTTAFTFLAPLPTDPPNVQRLHIDSVCQLKHLGRTTGSAEQVVVFTGPTTLNASNTTTYTAANGDQLFASWTGTGMLDPETLVVGFSGPEQYAGGTGRFRHASGSAFLTGSASLVSTTGAYTTRGSITY